MGLDGPDEDDSPTTARRDAPTAERDPVPVDGDLDDDSDETRAAYHIEYRALVDAEYAAAASDSWTEAPPALRRTWEDHEKKYPHPERSRPTPPDQPGAWRGDGDRELDALQNAVVDRGYDRIREVGEEVILPGMLRLEAEDPERCLTGLKNFLKKPDRLKEKVAGDISHKGHTAEQSLDNVKDAVRFTFVYDEQRYTESVHADCARLEAKGFERFDRQNSWEQDQYKGINSRWREPGSGLLFEVQFHTQASFDAKELTHRAYERLRGSVAGDAEREELETFQSTVSATIPIPPGSTEIEDYSPEKRDG